MYDRNPFVTDLDESMAALAHVECLRAAFAVVADVVLEVPSSPERTLVMRKLQEAYHMGVEAIQNPTPTPPFQKR